MQEKAQRMKIDPSKDTAYEALGMTEEEFMGEMKRVKEIFEACTNSFEFAAVISETYGGNPAFLAMVVYGVGVSNGMKLAYSQMLEALAECLDPVRLKKVKSNI